MAVEFPGYRNETASISATAYTVSLRATTAFLVGFVTTSPTLHQLIRAHSFQDTRLEFYSPTRYSLCLLALPESDKGRQHCEGSDGTKSRAKSKRKTQIPEPDKPGSCQNNKGNDRGNGGYEY